MREAKRGLFPLGGSAVRLPRQIPYTIAMDILLSARPVTALEAKEIGLVGRVVPDGTALDAALAVAEQVAACGPLSTQAILRAWRETEYLTEAEAMPIQDTTISVAAAIAPPGPRARGHAGRHAATTRERAWPANIAPRHTRGKPYHVQIWGPLTRYAPR